MENKKIEMSLFERLAITTSLLLLGFKNIVFGCLLIPLLVEKIGEGSFIISAVALGILAEGVLVAYCVLKLNGVMD